MNRINWTELKPQIQQVGRLSLPAILTQITTIAMQYIDSAMVGALGANASAAIGLVSSTTWLLSGTIYAVSAGFSVQVAHQIGGNHDKKARDVVRHGIASALVVSAVLCLIGLLISHPLPGWLGGAQKIGDMLLCSTVVDGNDPELLAHTVWNILIQEGAPIPDCGIYYASLGRASASEQERSEIMRNLDKYALCMVSFGQEAIKDA